MKESAFSFSSSVSEEGGEEEEELFFLGRHRERKRVETPSRSNSLEIASAAPSFPTRETMKGWTLPRRAAAVRALAQLPPPCSCFF